MANKVVFPAKQLDSDLSLTFDFTSQLPSGVTLSGVSVAVALWSGESSTLMTAQTPNISGYVATVVVSGGVTGSIYVVEALATGSDNNPYSISGFVAVVSNTI